jgi:hypothetical protein
MHTPLFLPRYRPGSLQSLFHSGVTQPDLVFLPDLLVKVLSVEVEVSLR